MISLPLKLLLGTNYSLVMTLALIIYFLLAFVLMRKLLLYGIRPTKTLAWLLAIFTITLGGMLFYLILGRNRKKNKITK
jgi:cardiolipin synthase